MASSFESEHGRKKKRKHSSDCSVSNSSEPIGELKVDFSLTPFKDIPPCTSAWDFRCLESMSIFYADSPVDLSEIMDKTNIFPALNSNQHMLPVLDMLKNSLTFDVDINSVLKMSHWIFNDFIEDSFEGAKKSIVEYAATSDRMHKSMVKPVLDFIDDTSCMLATVRREDACKAIFRQFFSSFISMCQLSPKNGEVYACKETLRGEDITSYPDLRIKCAHRLRVSADPCSHEGIVSVVKIDKYCGNEPLPSGRAPFSGDVGERPDTGVGCILDRAVLGQHGGQLLLEWQSSNINNRYMPGIIVTGSKVFFTLLDLSRHHMSQLRSNEDLHKEEMATIYYTESFDILKKSDRDILLETFVRLSMYSDV